MIDINQMNILREEPNTFIKEQAFRLANHNKVIAFAEGEGRNAVFLARQGNEVTAIDYSEDGLEKTKIGREA